MLNGAFHTNEPTKFGQNEGRPLNPDVSWRNYCWKKAYADVWEVPPREILLARYARAQRSACPT